MTDTFLKPRTLSGNRRSNVPWIGFYLNQAAARIRTDTASALRPLGITPPQLRALEAVSAGPISQARLGELVGMDRTTVVHVIDRFEELGVAKRNRDEKDRRSHAVTLTPAGEQILVEARALAKAAEDALLAPLASAERNTLHSLLRKLHESIACAEENP